MTSSGRTDMNRNRISTPPAAVAADRTEQASLLERLRRGDEAAYEELVRAQSGRMLSVARRFVRNEEDARDVVQQAFLSAFRALPEFHGQSLFTTWLHRIVVNCALMKLRSQSRSPEQPIEDLLPRFLEDGHHAQPLTDWGSADRLLMQRFTRERVRAAIDRLPESYRAVLLLRDIEELDTGEVARALGLTKNAAKIRVHRARQALATLLEPIFGGHKSGC